MKNMGQLVHFIVIARSNPLFGGFKSTKSMFGRSSHTWVEGEGMVHALYFNKDGDGSWNAVYNKRDTLKPKRSSYKRKEKNRAFSFFFFLRNNYTMLLTPQFKPFPP